MVGFDDSLIPFQLRGCEHAVSRLDRKGLFPLSVHSSRLFPDASLVKASAPESRSATQVAPLEISDS